MQRREVHVFQCRPLIPLSSRRSQLLGLPRNRSSNFRILETFVHRGFPYFRNSKTVDFGISLSAKDNCSPQKGITARGHLRSSNSQTQAIAVLRANHSASHTSSEVIEWSTTNVAALRNYRPREFFSRSTRSNFQVREPWGLSQGFSSPSRTLPLFDTPCYRSSVGHLPEQRRIASRYRESIGRAWPDDE